MFRFIRKIFIGLLTKIVHAFNHIKYVSLSNQKYTAQPPLVNLHPNEYTQGLHCYSFVVHLYRCVGSYNTVIDVSRKAMCSKQNRRFKCKYFQHDYMNKRIKKN